MSSSDVQIQMKKRRIVMGTPDGFEKPNPPGAKINVPVPKFTSAFDDSSRPVGQKPASKSKNPSTPPFILNATKVTKTGLNQNLKQLPIPKFALTLEKKEKETTHTFQILLPPVPRAATSSDQSKSVHTPLPPPPPPPLQDCKPGVPLNTRSAPIYFPIVKSPDQLLRTISTTEIALATDLSTETGTAELAHILLRDQHPEISASTSASKQQEWTVGLSPRKGSALVKGKGKEARFVKGGLAARASELIDQSHTSLALWQKEVELQLASSSIHLKPDLRLKILRIIDFPAGSKSSSARRPSTSNNVPESPGIALCRMDSFTGHYPQVMSRGRREQHYLVMLSFPTVAPPRLKDHKGVRVRNPEDFAVGRELYLWKPWQEVSLSNSPLPLDGDLFIKNNQDSLQLSLAPFPTIPSTIPQPSWENCEVHVDDLLICSRFIIMP